MNRSGTTESRSQTQSRTRRHKAESFERKSNRSHFEVHLDIYGNRDRSALPREML